MTISKQKKCHKTWVGIFTSKISMDACNKIYEYINEVNIM